jgi:hypothetical protein
MPKPSQETAAPENDHKNARSWRRNAWLVFVGVLALGGFLNQWLILGFPHLIKPLGPPDPDNWLYLAQTRQWLTGGWEHFYDNSVPRTNAPYGGIHIHWTRPMQILLLLFYALTPAAHSMDVRLMLAANWLPPCLCVAAAALLAKTARRHLDQVHVVICTILFVIFNTYRQNYFMPGDSDHHGLLSVLWCGVLAVVSAEAAELTALSLAASLTAGLALGVMLWISVEGAILIAVIYGLLGLEALFRPEKMRPLAFIAGGAFIAAALGLLVEKGSHGFFSDPVNDTHSIVYVFLMALCAAGMAGLSRLYATGIGLRGRIVAAGMTGSGVLLAMFAIFPKFFKGPMVDADPFILSDFLPNVMEAIPLHRAPWDDLVQELWQPLLATLLAGFCLWRRRLRPEKKRRLLLWLALLYATLFLTLFEVRWEYYLQPVAIAVCAALLPEVSMLAPRWLPARLWQKLAFPRQWRPDMAVFIFAFTLNAIVNAPRLLPLLGAAGEHKTGIALAKESTGPESCSSMVRFVLQTGQLPALLGSKDLVLLVTPDAGGDIMFFTDYRIIASNFHREGAGLHDIRRIASAKDAAAARPLLADRQVGAMLFCAEPGDPLWPYEMARSGKHPAWIQPVTGLHFPRKHGLTPVLYKVDPGPRRAG